MGVPGFFAWLLKSYKTNKIVLNSLDIEFDTLYLDSNCLFHPQCFKILNHFVNFRDKKKLERLMIKRILNYIDYLVAVVNPKTVYISVDGVAPMAKMNQQRQRRFKSINDNLIRNSIKDKYKVPYSKIWDNTCITPGTEFMEKLHEAIVIHLNKKRKREYIYSSYHTPGEGEHKILQHIKREGRDKVNIVYGLDADLIFLTLVSRCDNIYLLREAQHFGRKQKDVHDPDFDDIIEDVEEDLNFVDIQELRKTINIELKRIIMARYYKKFELELEGLDDLDFCDDFIFVCYLLGNDFLPHIPSINIQVRGLDLLLDCYADIFIEGGQMLVDSAKKPTYINNQFLTSLLESLSVYEDNYFKKFLPKYIERAQYRKCPTSDPYERAIWEFENLRNVKIDDPVMLGDGKPDEYKFRYYEENMGVSEHKNSLVEGMCKEYVRGLVWVTKYYFEECSCWEWQYPYSHAPFVSDLAYYFKNKKVRTEKVKFKGSQSLKPCTQLLVVLPPQRSNLLPKSYQTLVESIDSPILDLFPHDVGLDMVDQILQWKCVALVPTVDIDRVKTCVCRLRLTSGETERNRIYEPTTVFKE